MYNVLLISEQKLKSASPLDPNIDSEELRYGIATAQTIFIQETLGTNFYQQILEQVSTGDIDLSGNTANRELLINFIQPTLIAYSYYLVLDNLFIKAVNVGLQQFSSEQSQPIGLKEFRYFKDTAQQRGDFLNNLLRRHLVFNNFLYPAYTLTTNNGQLIPEFVGAFKTSITLPTRRFGRGQYGVNPVFDCPYPWWYGGPNSAE